MAETIHTSSKSPSTEVAKENTTQTAREKWEELRGKINDGMLEVKKKWRNLLGLDLASNENGQTIPAQNSEVPPIQENNIIPHAHEHELPVSREVIQQTPVISPEHPGQVEDQTVEIFKLPKNIAGSPHMESILLPNSHTLQAWETLQWIADKYKINLAFLTEINWITDPRKLEIKQEIALNRWAVKIQDKKEVLPQETHKVLSWETIHAIGKKYRLEENFLLRINGITDPNKIPAGQIIRLKEWVILPNEKKEEKPKEVEKKLAGWLTKAQHTALILKTCDNLGVTSKPQRAYILATSEHESDYYKTLDEYASWEAYEWRKDLGNTQIGDWVLFKWRGYVQLTGRKNYTDFDPILKWKKVQLIQENESIVINPELVKKPEIAAFILVHGMKNGKFGSKKIWKNGKVIWYESLPLDMFINNKETDWIAARKTVNGSDKAQKIAEEAQKKLTELEEV